MLPWTHLGIPTTSSASSLSTSSSSALASTFNSILNSDIERALSLTLVSNLNPILPLPLDPPDPLIHTLPLLNPTLELLMLDLFSVFLEVTLFLGCFRFLNSRGFIDQSGSNSFHVNVRFDHFGVVVGRTGKGDIGLFTQFPGSVDYRKGLLVA
jgi:hypothetical protein